MILVTDVFSNMIQFRELLPQKTQTSSILHLVWGGDSHPFEAYPRFPDAALRFSDSGIENDEYQTAAPLVARGAQDLTLPFHGVCISSFGGKTVPNSADP